MCPLAGLVGNWGTLTLSVSRELPIPWKQHESPLDCKGDCAGWDILIGTRDPQDLGLG